MEPLATLAHFASLARKHAPFAFVLSRLPLLALVVVAGAAAGIGRAAVSETTSHDRPAKVVEATADSMQREPADGVSGTPECGTARVVSAAADAWVDEAARGNNFGSDAILKVQSKAPAINFRVLVRFPLPAVPAGCALDSAVLRVYAASAVGGRTLQVLRVADDWSESGVTWANQPATAGDAATTTSGPGYRSWEVVSLVQALYAGANGGFLIRDAVENSSGSTEQQLHSREKGETPPELVLGFAPEGSAPMPPPPPDTTPPETTITSGPPSPTALATAQVTFAGVDDKSTALAFECRLDSSDGTAWSTCSSPRAYTDVAPGSHTFEVRASDEAGNVDPTPASHTWVVDPVPLPPPPPPPPPPPDTTPPETRITSAPTSPTTLTTAQIAFAGVDDESTTLEFECRLDSSDGAAWSRCSSPQAYAGLAPGSHAFDVRAVDRAGNADPTPAGHTWIIELPPPPPPVTTHAPEISGEARVGDRLTVSTGSWSGLPVGYRYSWLGCEPDGGRCRPLAGADRPSYTIGETDVGSLIRAAVTAINAGGEATAISAAVGPVAAVAPVLGRAAAGAEWFPLSADYKRSSRFSLTGAATLTHLRAYVDGLGGAAGSQQLRYAVYADVDGRPQRLLAQSEAGMVTAGEAAAWLTLALPASLALPPGAYHLTILSGPNGGVGRYSRAPATPALFSAADAFADGAASDYGSATADNYQLAIHALGSVAETAPSPPVTCDRVAAPTGSDANAGTLASPFLTAQKLAWSLSAGQTGCLRGGLYKSSTIYVLDLGGKGGFRIRSYPGEQAHLYGPTVVRPTAPNVTLSHLAFEGLGTTHPIAIYSADTVIEDSDITTAGRNASCLMLGSNDLTYGPASRTIIRRNRFHDCGSLLNGNKDHGIYAQHLLDAQITNNVFWNSAAYAIQLYPNAQRTRFAYNVVDGGGPSVRGGVIFAGEGGLASRDNIVEYNVIAYAATYNIDYYWGSAVGTGNVARRNCLWRGTYGNITGQVGFTALDNLIADPGFRDRANRDYRLSSTSPCLVLLGQDPAAGLG